MESHLKTKIMVFGTFDVLHKGHLDFFKQARKLSQRPYLVVSVARDFNVKKIKGRKSRFNEKERLAVIKKCRLVDKVVLGGRSDYIGHIVKEKPAIIALGYDQDAYVKGLKILLKNKGLAVKIARLKAYYPEKYKSSLVKNSKGL